MRLNQIYLAQNILKNMAFNYYAVARGRNVGIYNTWNECQDQVNNFSGCAFKKFHSKAEAEAFINERADAEPRYGGRSVAPTFTKRPLSQPRDYYKVGDENPYLTEQTSAKRRICSAPISNDHDRAPGEYITDKDGYVSVYTDGACSGNGRESAKAGIGVWFGDDHPLNVSRPVDGRATNNMAEIQAVTTACQQAKRAGIKNLKINTDSQFLISCINDWMPKWKRNGWKTSTDKPVINKTELLEMEGALSSLNVIWNHVNGHVGIHGNEMADKLARAGCQKY